MHTHIHTHTHTHTHTHHLKSGTTGREGMSHSDEVKDKFWLNQIQNCSIQIKKLKDGILSFQLKNKLRLPNVYILT